MSHRISNVSSTILRRRGGRAVRKYSTPPCGSSIVVEGPKGGYAEIYDLLSETDTEDGGTRLRSPRHDDPRTEAGRVKSWATMFRARIRRYKYNHAREVSGGQSGIRIKVAGPCNQLGNLSGESWD